MLDAANPHATGAEYIVYKSRAHRDAVNAKVMKDPRMKPPKTMPFDLKRMHFGGFDVLVNA